MRASPASCCQSLRFTHHIDVPPFRVRARDLHWPHPYGFKCGVRFHIRKERPLSALIGGLLPRQQNGAIDVGERLVLHAFFANRRNDAAIVYID